MGNVKKIYKYRGNYDIISLKICGTWGTKYHENGGGGHICCEMYSPDLWFVLGVGKEPKDLPLLLQRLADVLGAHHVVPERDDGLEVAVADCIKASIKN